MQPASYVKSRSKAMHISRRLTTHMTFLSLEAYFLLEYLHLTHLPPHLPPHRPHLAHLVPHLTLDSPHLDMDPPHLPHLDMELPLELPCLAV